MLALQATNLRSGRTYLCAPRWASEDEANRTLLVQVLAGHTFGLPDHTTSGQIWNSQKTDDAWAYQLITVLDTETNE